MSLALSGLYVRCLEHLLSLLDFVNDAFYVHPSQYPTWEQQSSNRAHICGLAVGALLWGVDEIKGPRDTLEVARG